MHPTSSAWFAMLRLNLTKALEKKMLNRFQLICGATGRIIGRKMRIISSGLQLKKKNTSLLGL